MSADPARQAMLTRMREVVERRGSHVAVRSHDCSYTYTDFGALIGQLHAALGRAGHAGSEPVGLLLDRSAAAYAAMWASIGHGRPYVPLNTAYPRSRLRNILSQANVRTVVCDEATHGLAQELSIDAEYLIVAGIESGTPVHSNGGGSHGIAAAGDGADTGWWLAREGGSIAYVLFTSGSTGQPKGVPISYDNLQAFITNMDAAIAYVEDDVCSQVCELSFDFSVEEIYLALLNGCTLCPARRVDLFNPAHYIASRDISVWISVPSIARVALNNGVPVADALHGLRLSIFNGEPLTVGVAAAWRAAAPNAEIWNTYGPTECTVAVTRQHYKGEPELAESDVVTLGEPFGDCEAAVLDDGQIFPVTTSDHGNIGELLLATPQRFDGYTDSQIPSPFVCDDHGTIYYRTGDRVRSAAGRLYFLGRVDHQVKIGGNRIELMEIEHQLRLCLGTESLAVIAHPARLPEELVLFIEGCAEVPALQVDTLGLPAYMLPGRTLLVDALPINPHGKLDRHALHSLADAGS